MGGRRTEVWSWAAEEQLVGRMKNLGGRKPWVGGMEYGWRKITPK